jgi:uncharacterized membrane protein
MSNIFTVHFTTFLAIIGMGLATYSTRLSGLLLMRGVVVQGRLKAALDAVPPAVLMAVITPTVFMTGRAETLAAIVTAAAAYLRLPLLVVILAGMLSVVGLRYFIQ